MKLKFLLAFVIVTGLGISNSQAQANHTIQSQHHRIKQGVKSGELTKAETKNLVKDQKEFHADKKEAKSDGVVTTQERKDLKKEKRQDSRKIYRKKHNERERP